MNTEVEKKIEGSWSAMAIIPEDAHVMLAAAVSTRNVTLITDTIMCISDLVAEIQGRFVVAIKPGVGKSMTFGSARLDPSQTPQTSFPCSRCDKKFESLDDLTVHSKNHMDEEVHSATQRLHSLSNTGGVGSLLSDAVPWPSQPSIPGSDTQSSPSIQSEGLISPQINLIKHDSEAAALKCPLCSKTFSKIFQLNLHLSRHQDGGDDVDRHPRRTYSCRFCSKEFYNMGGRNKHERMCKTGSSRMGRPMGGGSNVISTSQVFSCRKCKKPYADNANRLRHERMCRSGTNAISLSSPGMPATPPTPTPEHPTKSTGSSLELPISVNNYKHMASSAVSIKVLDENGRQTTMYSCVICAKLVQTRSSLESHYMSHLGIKPHACQYCTKRFTDASNWRKHQRGCTERPTDDLSGGLPTMAPPHSSFNFSADTSLPNDYPSMSVSPSNGGALSNSDSCQPFVKAEAIDVSSDNDMPSSNPNSVRSDSQPTTEISFEANISAEGGQLTMSGPVEPIVEVAGHSVDADMETEENKLINTANSVVVDSALSWFVEDKELTALHQDPEELMS